MQATQTLAALLKRHQDLWKHLLGLALAMILISSTLSLPQVVAYIFGPS